ncbi:alpha/beta hydrolase [Mumia zhuanghuii]|uniref:Alpha/beta fold hydrolase n=2 Tax=Mumia TaxID=1546255 RepID=A0ABW1QI85_9ACTN|nr:MULTISPECIES: alpha/beta hydrolase [Mumia]KAA1424684.1 alpha/beta hydrolase [Mumia zhuanghuii]
MTSHEPVLLISGAGLPAWIWDETRELLAPRETAVAPRPAARTARLGDYVDAALEAAPWDRFAVVAHSSGGVVGTELARRAAGRVTALLAVTAVVPRPGASFLSSMPFPQRHVLSLAMRVAGTRPPDGAIRRGVASGLDEPTADRVVGAFVPESVDLYRGRVGRTDLRLPVGYATTTRDRELTPALQRRFATNLGTSWQQTLDTGHLPMLEDPPAFVRTVAGFLDQRGADVSSAGAA